MSTQQKTDTEKRAVDNDQFKEFKVSLFLYFDHFGEEKEKANFELKKKFELSKIGEKTCTSKKAISRETLSLCRIESRKYFDVR